MVDILKDRFSDRFASHEVAEKPHKQKLVSRMIASRPNQPRQVSYAARLREAKNKDAYNSYMAQKRKAQAEAIMSGAKTVGASVSSGAKKVGGFLGQKSADVKRIGLKGLWKKSIY